MYRIWFFIYFGCLVIIIIRIILFESNHKYVKKKLVVNIKNLIHNNQAHAPHATGQNIHRQTVGLFSIDQFVLSDESMLLVEYSFFQPIKMQTLNN